RHAACFCLTPRARDLASAPYGHGVRSRSPGLLPVKGIVMNAASRLFVALFAAVMLVLPVSKVLAADAAAKDETVKGKIVATKWDDAKKVTAVDLKTADNKTYHLTGDKAKDLFEHVDHEV